MRPLPQLSHQGIAVDPFHAPSLQTRLVRWPDEAACAAFAAALARRPELADACLHLQGDLGAGKTTFVRHLLRALGVAGRVKSPTYTLMESYAIAGRPPLAAVSHFDFYRFADPREWEDAGLREVFAAPGLKLVEWPEHAAGLLPLPDVLLLIAVDDDESRRVEARAFTPRGVALLE